MNCIVLIFSKDRALQLDATLRSFLLHCQDVASSQICILHTASTAFHEGQYKQLEQEYQQYPFLQFIHEHNFYSDTIALLAPFDHVLFLTDDNIFVRDFSISEVIENLQRHQNALGFSLRLGRNTTYCYPLDKAQQLPDFQTMDNGMLKFNWTVGEHDFGYPLEVSSSVYRVEDILPFIAQFPFKNPNTLESLMAERSATFRNEIPYLLCFEQSATFCAPINMVQAMWMNRASNKIEYSIDNLGKLFDDGLRIDISAYNNFTPNACHQEVDLKLIDPSPSPLFFGSKPKFSVIMANYNQDKFIGQSIESVLHQTFQDWELIIVDDHSTDKSLAMVEKYLSDKRIRLIKHNNNKGYIAALKTGIDNVSNEFFGILDSDDVLLPDAIETIYAAHITNDDAGMVYSQFMYCDEGLNPTQLGYCKQIPEGKTNLEVDTVSHFKTFKLKYYLQTEGFAEHCFCAEDKDITYKIEEVSRLLFIDKVLYHYRVLPKSQSHDGEKRQKGLFNMSRAKINAIKRRDEKNREQQKVAIEYFRNATEYLYQLDFVNAESQINNYRKMINYDSFPKHDGRKNSSPDISVIIVAYKTNPLLLDCINSVLNQTNKNFEIIVVDNGGNDEVANQLISLPILHIKCPINFILSEGRNIGAYFAKSEIIAFLDDDATVPNNYIESIVEAFDTYEIVGFRGKVLAKNTAQYRQLPETYDLGEVPIPASIDAEGNSIFLKKEYQNLNGMNPLLFGGEGLDLSIRILSRYGEHKTIYWPKTVICHDPAGDDKEKIKSDRYKIMHNYLQFKYPDVWQRHSFLMRYARDEESKHKGHAVIKRKVFEKSEQSLAEQIRALSEEGGKLLEDGYPEAALSKFDEILLTGQNIPDIQCARAVALFQIGRFDEAIIAAQSELAINPNYEVAGDLIARINSLKQEPLIQSETPKVILTSQKETSSEQQGQKNIQKIQEKRYEQIYNSEKPLCLFLNVYYPAFLNSHYEKNPQLQSASYQEQLASIQEAAFGDSDFYSDGLKKAGWDAEDFIINCSQLQQTWAKENKFSGNEFSIAVEQVRRAQPDVIYIQDINMMSAEFFDAVRPFVKLIVGQIATPIVTQIPFNKYDIIFSSFPHYVKRFSETGVSAYYQPLGFAPRVLKQPVSYEQRPIQCSFVGGISKLHIKAYSLFEALARETPIEFWGYGAETLANNSLVRGKHHGEAWGKEMFNILMESKITINRHGEIAENYANNVRLFEATGCGALLITDYKDNLNELFEIGKEVVAYHTPEECVELVRYYLANLKEAEEIARAGQVRTLRDHIFTKRMAQTAHILERHLQSRSEKKRFEVPEISKTLPIKPPYSPNLSTEQILSNSAIHFCNQANTLIDQRNFLSALRLLDEAMYLYPQIKGLQYLRAVCLSSLGRIAEAEVAARSELKVQPGFEPVLTLLNNLHKA